MRFRAKVELNGKTATGIEVPAEVVAALEGGKRVPVLVTLGTHTYRSTVASMGGRFMLPVSAEVRQAAGVAAGDAVEVGIERDEGPREVDVPADLLAALAREPEANRRFEQLSYSAKRQLVLAIQGAKTEATRRRRIESSLDRLRQVRA